MNICNVTQVQCAKAPDIVSKQLADETTIIIGLGLLTHAHTNSQYIFTQVCKKNLFSEM